jgi:hypothetical protein
VKIGRSLTLFLHETFLFAKPLNCSPLLTTTPWFFMPELLLLLLLVVG